MCQESASRVDYDTADHIGPTRIHAVGRRIGIGCERAPTPHSFTSVTLPKNLDLLLEATINSHRAFLIRSALRPNML